MFNPIWRFDFKVVIDNHVVTLPVGKSIAVPVRLELIRGNPQQIKLDFTNWESVGLIASIHFSEMPPGKPWKADLLIRASASTPPGSYLFTVRGSAKGTFHTSQDAVTVIVEPKDKQKADDKDVSRAEPSQRTSSGSPSLDLDQLFKPDARPKVEVSPSEDEEINQPAASSNSIGAVIGVIFGIIIIFLILAASGVFDNNPKTTKSRSGSSNCPTTCPGGVGVHVPQSCKCPAACPYTYIKDVGGGFKECASIRPR
jgi:hypothetical protein